MKNTIIKLKNSFRKLKNLSIKENIVFDEFECQKWKFSSDEYKDYDLINQDGYYWSFEFDEYYQKHQKEYDEPLKVFDDFLQNIELSNYIDTDDDCTLTEETEDETTEAGSEGTYYSYNYTESENSI